LNACRTQSRHDRHPRPARLGSDCQDQGRGDGQGRGYSFDILRARLLFGKRVKPAEQPWRPKVAFKADEADLRWLVKEQSGRCQSCGVQLGRAKDNSPHVAVLMREREQKRVLVCTLCYEGFHTQALNQKKARSTP
jgi:hypothetical protein